MILKIRYRLPTMFIVVAACGICSLMARLIWLDYSQAQAKARLESLDVELHPVPGLSGEFDAYLNRGDVNIVEICSHIRRMGKVRTLQMSNARLATRDWQAIGALRNVRAFVAYESDLGNAVSYISGMSALEEVDFVRCHIDADIYYPISKLKALRSLKLERTSMSHVELSALAIALSMERLDLSHTTLNDNDASALATLQQVKYLNVAHTSLTDKGLHHIAKMTGLVQLDLTGAELSGDELGSLQGLDNLVTLSLAKGSRPTLGVGALCFCQDVVSQDPDASDTVRAFLEVMPKTCKLNLSLLPVLPALRELDITCVIVDTESIVQLSKLPSLEVLWADRTNLTDESLEILAMCPNLRDVKGRGARITTRGVERARARDSKTLNEDIVLDSVDIGVLLRGEMKAPEGVSESENGGHK